MNDSVVNNLYVRLHRRSGQGGPPPGLLAAVSTGLFVGAIALGTALGGTYPSPFTDPAEIHEYFRTQSDAVKASGILMFASSVPLAIYAATVSTRLRRLGVTAPGTAIAHTGGLLAAAMLGLCGLLQWTLARPAVRINNALVRALQDLAFLTGGPAHVVFLGLLVAGMAVPGLILRLLPRPLAWAGLAIGVVAELTTLVLVWPSLAVLLPLVRFPALAWLIVAGLALPRQRPRRAPATRSQGPEPEGAPEPEADRARPSRRSVDSDVRRHA